MTPALFRVELVNLMPNGDLRLVRDPRRLGLDLWVVERKVPAREHAEGLEQIRLAGESRYVEVDMPDIGLFRYDCAPEWIIVHVCKTETCDHQPPQFSRHESSCVREPDQRDVKALKDYLYEFRNFEHSREVLLREKQERKDALDKEFSDYMQKELKASHEFKQLVFSAPNVKALEGTDV
jgi:hypothetical protein